MSSQICDAARGTSFPNFAAVLQFIITLFRYVQPPCGTTYFKSTDGHYGKWAFSLRRLNLHLAIAAVKGGAAAVVDATRSGKLYPDSTPSFIAFS